MPRRAIGVTQSRGDEAAGVARCDDSEGAEDATAAARRADEGPEVADLKDVVLEDVSLEDGVTQKSMSLSVALAAM